MQFLAAAADHRTADSVSAKLRQRRFKILNELLNRFTGTVRILDVGGTADYWLNLAPTRNPNWEITLLNIDPPDSVESGFHYIQGDACDLSRFADQSFQVVVSNSVIEHVGDWHQQQRMASEVQRVGQSYYVQTPNRYFPIEPHFLTPGFQFLPEWAQVWLVQHCRLGTYDKVPERQAALALVREIRLLSEREFKRLFPAAKLHVECFWGLAKSFAAVGRSQ